MTASHTAYIPSLIQSHSRWLELPILVGFNLLLVASAYLAINVPFSPVPITGQTFGVLFVAMALGKTRGTAVVAAYLLEGAAGLPVFAAGSAGIARFVGPTGGYLIGFVAAAWVVGWLAERGWDRSYTRSVVAMTTGTAIIFALGLIQLSIFLPAAGLIAAGFSPFVPGAAIKIALAAVILPTVWKTTRRHSS